MMNAFWMQLSHKHISSSTIQVLLHRPRQSKPTWNSKYVTLFLKRYYHQRLSNIQIQKKRVEIYERELKRQNDLLIDIEKIQVKYDGPPEKVTLIMNKHLSTPFNCAQHINTRLMKESVIAEVDGEIWDMFRPIAQDCTLKFLHFREPDPFYVNKAFWRSLSIMLGSVLETAFNDDLHVDLCSFPPPQVRSGSFVYDVDIDIDSWEPRKEELRVLSSEIAKLSMCNHAFQRLEVDMKVALKMFEDNQYKKSQIPHIAKKSKTGSSIVLYRIGNFIEISKGPCISHTGHVGKCSIAAVIPVKLENKKIYRVQGVAIPSGMKMNHYTYSLLEENAARLNSGRLPFIENHNNEKDISHLYTKTSNKVNV